MLSTLSRESPTVPHFDQKGKHLLKVVSQNHETDTEKCMLASAFCSFELLTQYWGNWCVVVVIYV